MEEELGAVAIFGALPVVVELDVDGIGHVSLRVLIGCDVGLELGEVGLAGRGVDKRLEENRETERAGVNDAVLFENRQKVGCTGNGLIRLDDESIEIVGNIHLGLLKAVSLGGDILEHGQDRAFDRLADGLESDFHAAAQSMRNITAGSVLALGVAQTFGNAAKDLARDDARVAAGTHERAVRDGGRDLIDRGVCRKRLDLAHNGIKRERHVGAGITIGHGEDVEFVDFLGTVGNGLCGCGETRADD